MPSNLTQMSAAEYDKILYGNMTPSMAAAYLQERDIPLRNFPQVLQSMYPGADLLPRLVEYLSRIGPEEGGASAQSLGKKAHNWLSGRNVPASREEYFRIAFALGLGESQLNTLLGLFTDYGIQYRDGRELVFAWFLRHGFGYLDALRFYEALPLAPGMERLEPGRNSQLTHELHNRFQLIQTMEELRHCYLENLEYFGSLHLRAYYYFQGYLDQLIHPVPSWDAGKEPDYSIEMVMNTYLSMQVPAGAKRSHYSLIQKLIRQNWPNTTALNNIRNHKLDVAPEAAAFALCGDGEHWRYRGPLPGTGRELHHPGGAAGGPLVDIKRHALRLRHGTFGPAQPLRLADSVRHLRRRKRVHERPDGAGIGPFISREQSPVRLTKKQARPWGEIPKRRACSAFFYGSILRRAGRDSL